MASVVDPLTGLRFFTSPYVPEGRGYLMYPGDPSRSAVLYRDRYDLMLAVFWARMGSRLDALAEQAARDFRAWADGRWREWT